MNIEELAKNAEKSLLFTAPVIGPHLERFLARSGDELRALAARAVKEQVAHVYWVGCGNSLVNLWSGKYLLDRFGGMSSDVYPAYEFVWRNPERLRERSWVFLASFSGSTEDTVVALRHAKRLGAKTIVLVNKADSLMGQEADVCISYDSTALYILPLAAAYIFALEYCRSVGASGVQEILEGLRQLPPLLTAQFTDERAPALQLATECQSERMFYTLGTGVLHGLAYKFGLTVFMENMRVNGSFIDATEFRHGPVEMLDREKPCFVVLLGNDETRVMVERVIAILKNRDVRVLVYDAARFTNIHPMLAPFTLMIPLQWFAVYSAFHRGITDLDERVLMGHGILGKGEGVTWP